VTPSTAAVGAVHSAVRVGDGIGGLPSGIISGSDVFGLSLGGLGDIDGDGIPDMGVHSRYDDDGATDAGALYILFMKGDGTAKGYQKISLLDGAPEGGGPVGLDISSGSTFGRTPGRLD